ncbi:MAG: sensor histidine kinase [Acidimicrobiia bacterium]|nr:sensor histidine kinase [Acidimicrobiia bacterium]
MLMQDSGAPTLAAGPTGERLVLGSGRRVALVTVALVFAFAGSAWWADELAADRLPADALLVAANTLPLLAVRWNPVLVVLAFAVAYPLWLDPPPLDVGRDGHILQSLPTLVALYASGSWGRPLWQRAIALVTPAWMLAASLLRIWPSDPLEIGYIALVLVVMWALGVVVAERDAYVSALEARARELEEAQRALAERTVADERARIARELHDVVAHAMSVITVQAGVGAHLMESQPPRAGEALAVIERTGREALYEMRRMLTVLRAPGGDGAEDDEARPGQGRDPQPGLTDLPALVATAADAGVAVSLQTQGPVRPLPAGLDLTAFRIVQEALTNVTKHAPGAAAAVTVRYRPGEVALEVSDRGGPSAKPVVAGQGLRGMAERVALYDGELEVAPGREGFRVSARFPVEERG